MNTTRSTEAMFSFFQIFCFQFSGIAFRRVIRQRTDSPFPYALDTRFSVNSQIAYAQRTVKAMETMLEWPSPKQKTVAISSKSRRNTNSRYSNQLTIPCCWYRGKNTSFSVFSLLRRPMGNYSSRTYSSPSHSAPRTLYPAGLGLLGYRLKEGRSSRETLSFSSELTIDFRSTASPFPTACAGVTGRRGSDMASLRGSVSGFDGSKYF